MKIAYICREYHRHGGVGRCVAEIASKLSKKHDVSVFAYSWEKTKEDENINFQKVFSFPAPYFLKVVSFSFFSFLKIKNKKFDLISAPLGSTFSGALFTAHSCHRWWIEEKKKTISGRIRLLLNPLHFFLLFLEKINLKHTPIIAVSNKIKDKITEYYHLPSDKIKVIPNGINLKDFNFSILLEKKYWHQEISKKYELKKGIILLFVAHEFRRKGLKNLIQALSEIPRDDIFLLVVGKDNPHYYKKFVLKQKIQNRVIFVGNVKNILPYYAGSDIFIFPTIQEPFGLAILEAMACGLVVITSKDAGAAELIIDQKEGILLDDPNDIEEIKNKLEYILNNPSKINFLGENAAQKAKMYSWEKISEITEKFYYEYFNNH